MVRAFQFHSSTQQLYILYWCTLKNLGTTLASDRLNNKVVSSLLVSRVSFDRAKKGRGEWRLKSLKLAQAQKAWARTVLKSTSHIY